MIASLINDITNPNAAVMDHYFAHCENRFKSVFRHPNRLSSDLADGASERRAFEKAARAPHLLLPDFAMTYPAAVPQKYTVSPGDHFKQIAQKFYGDEGFAGVVAQMNGYALTDPLVVGQILILPQYLPSTNHAGNVTPYEQFMQIMIGRLSPHLNLTLSHHHGFVEVVHGIVESVALIAGVVISAFVPVFAPLTVAVFSALVEAAYQGVAVATHLQAQFSLAQVITVGLEAGISAGILGAGQAGLSTWMQNLASQSLQTVIKQTAQIGVMNQFTEMMTGLRHQFDFGAVVGEVVSTAMLHQVSPQAQAIFKESPFVGNVVQNEARSLVGNGIRAVIDRQESGLDLKQITLTALGTTLSQAINTKLEQEALMAEYERVRQESLAASRNARLHSHATQLINHETKLAEITIAFLRVITIIGIKPPALRSRTFLLQPKRQKQNKPMLKKRIGCSIGLISSKKQKTPHHHLVIP